MNPMNIVISGIFAASLMTLGILSGTAFAQQTTETEDLRQQLQVSETPVNKTDKYQLQEQRIGGRLNRVTVNWNNGITEVYKNGRDDTIWYAEEDSLGDQPNVRQWRIGGW